ncbi:AMP-binding protein [Embleya sp. NPDC059259]|uniref:AMP-binding protein n=1 Tax=unclassified Embleya TaxID=2699296 RepID=UPI003688A622
MRDESVRSWTYAQLCDASARFANVLAKLEVGRGERVFTLLDRCPELFATVLGALRNGSVLCPLFAAFGPDPVCERLRLGDARVLVTTTTLYQRKVAARRSELPRLEYVLIVGPDTPQERGVFSYDLLTQAVRTGGMVAPTGPEDMALLHFTSGTTGTPKGAVHVHDAVVAHHATALTALDLHPGDVYWCTANPGWVTGMSYGIIAPLTCGVTLVVDEGDFDVRRWYRILTRHKVTVWYTSQTETGCIMIANFTACDIRSGSMGRPVPGVTASVLARGADGRAEVANGKVTVLDEAGVEGELALRVGGPSMFRGYLHEPDRYDRCFADGWYLTGDLARQDPDGWFWFVGRADDVIKSAGHLIGSFEVESALLEHPAVAESGVVGRPDPLAGAIVKAFVSLRPGFEPTDGLRRELLAFTRVRLGPAVAPREIEFDQDLPKTNSGKVVRRLLRARELGLPEGDVSTVARS